MDVHCSTYGEPWDTYHLRHDAISETDVDFADAEAWRSLPGAVRLNARYRDATRGKVRSQLRERTRKRWVGFLRREE
jgi:hypothetical protein